MIVPAAAHVFVLDLGFRQAAAGTIELATEDEHHLRRALRLRPGETVTACDGNGSWRVCTWTGDVHAPLEVAGPVRYEARRRPEITVAFAPVKGDRTEWALQKLVEVGVDHVVLLDTDRTVVRWEAERAGRHLERLRRVAREAAMQSRQVWLPGVDGPEPFGAMVTGTGIALADREGGFPSLARPVILVGPEGGWTEGEMSASVPRVALGAAVMRTETAAVAAGVLLTALRSGLVAEPPSADREALRL